jgi:CheY-like chemotaxis protein
MKKISGLDCVLLVDDDDATNFIHQMVIQRLNLDVKLQVVHNGKEAIEYLTCTGKFSNEIPFPQPGIIFLDINMPIMNGWEFLEEYKKLSEEQKAKIVIAMLTTSANPDDEKKAKGSAEIVEFINKPLEEMSLEFLIQKYYK